MIYSEEEQSDGFAMIEWASRQPWSTGAVGVWGISFGGSVALQQARRRHPALKAILVRSGTDNNYTEWTNPGGTPRPYQYTVCKCSCSLCASKKEASEQRLHRLPDDGQRQLCAAGPVGSGGAVG